jgi:hypothetical protein
LLTEEEEEWVATLAPVEIPATEVLLEEVRLLEDLIQELQFLLVRETTEVVAYPPQLEEAEEELEPLEVMDLETLEELEVMVPHTPYLGLL